MKRWIYWALISLPVWGYGCPPVVAKAKAERAEIKFHQDNVTMEKQLTAVAAKALTAAKARELVKAEPDNLSECLRDVEYVAKRGIDSIYMGCSSYTARGEKCLRPAIRKKLEELGYKFSREVLAPECVIERMSW